MQRLKVQPLALAATGLHADPGPANALGLLLYPTAVFWQLINSLRFSPRAGGPAIAPLGVSSLP